MKGELRGKFKFYNLSRHWCLVWYGKAALKPSLNHALMCAKILVYLFVLFNWCIIYFIQKTCLFVEWACFHWILVTVASHISYLSQNKLEQVLLMSIVFVYMLIVRMELKLPHSVLFILLFKLNWVEREKWFERPLIMLVIQLLRFCTSAGLKMEPAVFCSPKLVIWWSTIHFARFDYNQLMYTTEWMTLTGLNMKVSDKWSA